MRKTVYMRYFLVVVVALILSSCASKFRQIEKSDDWKVKYEAALAYYDEQDYFRAGALFSQIEGIVRGLPEGEQVQFKLAYTNFYDRSYLLSSHYFKTFFETYARSEMAEEAEYMYAYSLYANSPIFNLEQSSSYEAIDAMQNFLNKYTETEYAAEATEVIDEMQRKLETKAYENAKQYHKLRIYKSALMGFENFRKDFPDSKYNEEIAFLKIETQFDFAEKSLYTKQKERYTAVKSFYESFIDTYPSSEYLENAEKYYSISIDKLSKFATPAAVESNSDGDSASDKK
jgi:outer membrane protein assembly factor BamD